MLVSLQHAEETTVDSATAGLRGSLLDLTSKVAAFERIITEEIKDVGHPKPEA